jgi:hypothetical protein
MQAGGLAPPPPESETDESVKTEENLQKADQEDSGRGLEFFYVNVEGGVQHLGLQTLHANNLTDAAVAASTQTGPMFGAGLGVRLLFITIGPRFRLAHFGDFDIWTLGGEVGFHFPLGNFEPYFDVGAGYASLGSFNGKNIANDAVSVHGYDIRGGGGFDYYLTPVFSVGANVSVDLVGLTRPGVNPQAINPTLTASPQGSSGTVNYAADGSSLGMGVSGTAVLGLHF